MSLAVGPGPGDDERLVAEINTTPLVDVMLVLLIIFLITIPVVITAIPVQLPKERHQPRQTRPDHITLSVDRDGAVFWNDQRVAGPDALLARLKAAAQRDPPPEVHVRGDAAARYESIGRIVLACQRAGLSRIAFVVEPPPRGS